MSLESDLMAANGIGVKIPDPQPESPKKTRPDECFRCGEHPRMKGISYCKRCHAARMVDYYHRKRKGKPIRGYRKKVANTP